MCFHKVNLKNLETCTSDSKCQKVGVWYNNLFFHADVFLTHFNRPSKTTFYVRPVSHSKRSSGVGVSLLYRLCCLTVVFSALRGVGEKCTFLSYRWTVLHQCCSFTEIKFVYWKGWCSSLHLKILTLLTEVFCIMLFLKSHGDCSRIFALILFI